MDLRKSGNQNELWEVCYLRLAAQQQGAKAEEAVAKGANCNPAVHNHDKYTYRPNNCKTFLQKSPAPMENVCDVEFSCHEIYLLTSVSLIPPVVFGGRARL